jgi:hypothetical protein
VSGDNRSLAKEKKRRARLICLEHISSDYGPATTQHPWQAGRNSVAGEWEKKENGPGWRTSKGRKAKKKKKEKKRGASTAITVNAPTIYNGCTGSLLLLLLRVISFSLSLFHAENA